MSNSLKNVAIFYFSGTGNTWYVSDKLKNCLTESGLIVKIYSVEALSEKESNGIISKNDLVIFGYPIYASYMPAPMIKFINGLKTNENKPSAIFCTQMIFSGDGAKVCDYLIEKKGFKTKWAIHFNMANNLNCGPFKFLPVTNDEEKLKKMRQKTDKRIEKFSNLIVNNKEFKQGFSKASGILAKMQRPIEKKDHTALWKNSMSIDKDLCIKCGKCARLCPMRNVLNDGSIFYTNGNCCGCLRCHNFCPAKAVMYKGSKNIKENYQGPIKGFDPIILTKK